MNTTQTIDGVSRELLERILEVPSHPEYTKAWKELRALLDAPEVLVVPLTGPKEWLDSLRPAAQPQGVPAAWAWVDEKGEHGVTLRWDVAKHLPYFVKPLYAEQPAPVAQMCDCNQGRLPCRCKS